ncbi:hypothetical protein P0136_01440 [Lentisphaerota bacterium ZTH]|nr:hypothetical protein JYG24_07420 [Lentisphaerota bacterium]WET06678.1 hypothetical protein P0136_01440 [Lentisphaerota bacterium ZTH]
MQNIKFYYAFLCFNGMSLAVAANPLFLDKILLEMKIDLSFFGTIKGASLFIGSLGSLLISHHLEKLSREKEVIIAGFTIRLLLPFLLVLSMFFLPSGSALTWSTFFITSLCYFTALTCLNSQDVLLKKISPVDSLSENNGYALSLSRLCTSFFSVVAALVWAWLETDNSFASVYCLLLLLCAGFHLPASISLLKIKVKTEQNISSDRKSPMRFSDILTPVKDKTYLPLLGIAFATNMYYGGLSAYLFPYILKVIEIKFHYLVIFDLIISVGVIVLAGKWGVFQGRFGSRKVLNIIVCGLMFSLLLLFSKSIISILLFSILVWSGITGLLSSGLLILQRSLCIQNSCNTKTNIYIASAALFSGTGFLTGNVAASIIFGSVQSILPSSNNILAYQGVFASLCIPCLMILAVNNLKGKTYADSDSRLQVSEPALNGS